MIISRFNYHNYLIGSVPGWIGKCCHGDNEEKVYRKLCQIVDEWIEIYAQDGRPLPLPTAGNRKSGCPGDCHAALDAEEGYGVRRRLGGLRSGKSR